MKCLECSFETGHMDDFALHMDRDHGHVCAIGRDETVSQVREFHRAMGHPYDEKPRVPVSPTAYAIEEAALDATVRALQNEVRNVQAMSCGDSVRLLRARLMIEELAETLDAMLDGNIDEVLKELCDLQYVLDGTFLAFGLDRYKTPAFRAVHASNMSKLDDNGRPVYKDGKVVKGDNYVAPELHKLFL